MQAGELLLVDAAVQLRVHVGRHHAHLSGRAARSRRCRRTSTQIVLQAQDEGDQASRAPARRCRPIHDKTVEVIKAGLLKLGLITDTSGDQYRMWYTHGADALHRHRRARRRRPQRARSQPGMAFTIEPGIYIRQSALDALPRDAGERRAHREDSAGRARSIADIGVRIEDSFLLEESGLRRLSASVPRTIEEIEAFMQADEAASDPWPRACGARRPRSSVCRWRSRSRRRPRRRAQRPQLRLEGDRARRAPSTSSARCTC